MPRYVARTVTAPDALLHRVQKAVACMFELVQHRCVADLFPPRRKVVVSEVEAVLREVVAYCSFCVIVRSKKLITDNGVDSHRDLLRRAFLQARKAVLVELSSTLAAALLFRHQAVDESVFCNRRRGVDMMQGALATERVLTDVLIKFGTPGALRPCFRLEEGQSLDTVFTRTCGFI